LKGSKKYCEQRRNGKSLKKVYLFAELRRNEGNAAIFFLPAKISAARELQAQKAKEIEEVQAQKCQLQLEKQQHKEEQAELKRIATVVRLEKKEKLALAKAQKQAQKEVAIQQRLASLQLSNEQKAISKKEQKKRKKIKHQASSNDVDIEPTSEPVVLEEQMPISRSGRRLHKPKYLENYQL
jgi:hypothetical protein